MKLKMMQENKTYFSTYVKMFCNGQVLAVLCQLGSRFALNKCFFHCCEFKQEKIDLGLNKLSFFGITLQPIRVGNKGFFFICAIGRNGAESNPRIKQRVRDALLTFKRELKNCTLHN